MAMLLTIDGDILATNQIGAARLGLNTQNAVGKNVFNIFDPETAAQRKNKFEELLEKKQPMQFVDQRDGRFYLSNLYPILDNHNAVENVAVFAVDITEQKRLQKKSW
jgi:PAS domain S-box-containing protein